VSRAARVAGESEGNRNNGLFKAACRAGELVGAGALEREVVEEALAAATTLPPEEALPTIRNGLDRGIECPRDLSRVHRNGDGAGDVNEAVDDPHRLARLFRDKYCRHADGTPTIQYWQGGFLLWGGAYRSIELHEIHAHLTGFIKDEFDKANLEAIDRWEQAGGDNSKGERGPKPKCLKVTRALVANTALALGGYALLDGRTENPAWLLENPPFPALEVLPMRNFLVHLPGWARGDGVAALREPHPNFFGLHALDYDFDPAAPKPMEWLRFLGAEPITKTSLVKLQLWPKDLESIMCLQEWMGYLLTCDTSQQKILGLIGPRRCGKGTISRVIRALVGTPNVAYPTLGSLGTQFGLQPLIGKLVAIVADARLSGHTDLAAVVENLLSVSGEDARTVDRKHLTSLTLRLYTRFVVLANDIPKLIDASGALVGRMIILRLVASFFGMEDRNLMTYFTPELPGILLWAIEGWKRLNERGYFLQPASGQDDIDLMAALGSPVGAFVADQCEVGPEHEVAIQALFEAWKAWCVSKGREKSAGDYHTFGKNLRAAVPTITTLRKGSKAEERVRHYQGIGLATPEDGKPF
jgi:putative DNA primase/helicase